MEGGGSGISKTQYGGRQMTWAWQVYIYLSHASRRIATNNLSHCIEIFAAISHTRRKHVDQVSTAEHQVQVDRS
jgi:hypothetical protein